MCNKVCFQAFKLIIVVIGSFFITNVSGQTWQQADSLKEVYIEKESLDTALIYAEQALELTKIELGTKDTVYANILASLLEINNALGKYQTALEYGLQELDVREKVQGKNHPDYGRALSNLASLYENIEQYDKALQFYIEAQENIEKSLGKENLDYIINSINLAVLYDNMGQYDKTMPLYLEALGNIEKLHGREHPFYGVILNNFAGLYESMGQYDKALPLYLEALENVEQTLGKEHSEYGTNLNNIAILYYRMGQYDKAVQLMSEALINTKKTLGKNHSSYGTRLNNVAQLYHSLGQYEQAMALYLEAIENTEKTLGKNHSFYGTNLNNVACLYLDMGQYDKALPLYFEALENTEMTLGKDHPSYGTRLNNIAYLYDNMGQYDKALPLYLEALKNTEKVLGKEHPDYGTRLNNIAGIYKNMGQYDKAFDLYIEALENAEKALGKEHPSYGTSLNNLAGMYRIMGQYEKALPLYFEVLENKEIALGKNHPEYGLCLNNLVGLYIQMGQYEKALPLSLEALANLKNTLGENHIEYERCLNNITDLYIKMGQYEKALPLFRGAIQNNFYNINQAFSFLAESEKEKFIKTLSKSFNSYKSFFLDYAPENPEVAGDAYNIELATKGIILQVGIQMREIIQQKGDSIALATYDQWQSLRLTIAKQYSLPIDKRLQNLPEMEAEAEMLEGELTRVSSAFAESKQLGTITWRDVQHILQPNEVCVEFSSFAYKKAGENTDSIMYVALVLLPESEQPILVPLCEQKQLDSILVKSLSNNTSLNSMYRALALPDFNSLDYGKRLYELIWKALEKYIPEKSLVYFSPSGSLHKIAFAAIPLGNNIRLSDKYKLMQVSSTAVLLQKSKFGNTKPESIALFGGINYDTEVDELFAKAENIRGSQEFVSRSISSDAERGNIKWNYLPGTMQEVEAIDNLAKKKKLVSKKFTGNAAIEEQFKSLQGDNSPGIIHISTHGFFFEDTPQGENYNAAKNPLNRAGLLFAGANNAWQGIVTNNEIDDGILTAYEATNVVFGNTQLVVLSACETGLGEIKGSEGVFGLQRAFKNAGVEYIIMSLWKVPDTETAEFMEYFYKKLFKGISIPDAFRSSQNYMKKKYPEDPYKWAAFVLVK